MRYRDIENHSLSEEEFVHDSGLYTVLKTEGRITEGKIHFDGVLFAVVEVLRYTVPY